MHSTSEGAPSGADRCRTCGGAMAERWNATRTGVALSCAQPACPVFGVPNLRQVRHAVVVNDRGDVLTDQ